MKCKKLQSVVRLVKVDQELVWCVIYPNGKIVYGWNGGKERCDELSEKYNKFGIM